MSNKKYYIEYFDNTVKEVEIEKETKSFIWIDGKRNSKTDSFGRYFDSHKLAVDQLELHLRRRVDYLKQSFEDASKELENFKNKYWQ